MRAAALLLSSVLVACLGDASTSGAGAGGGGGADAGGAGGVGGLGGLGGAGGGLGGLGGGGGAGGAGGAALPGFDDAAWETGDAVGFGIAFKDTGSPAGENVFLAYAGYGIPLDAAQSWAKALWDADLAARGVRYVFAIQGPASPGYEGLEIGNSKIAAWLVANLAPGAWVAAAGHSSGSYVAQELLGQLAGAADPGGVTAERVVYFSLDGGYGLSAPTAERLRASYFVGAVDGGTGTSSPNRAVMQSMAQTYAAQGAQYWELDATGSGCDAGAAWCVHMTPINTLPHDPTGGDVADYLDFVGRPVALQYLVANAQAAGLLP